MDQIVEYDPKGDQTNGTIGFHSKYTIQVEGQPKEGESLCVVTVKNERKHDGTINLEPR
jgi:hypothetical protein